MQPQAVVGHNLSRITTLALLITSMIRSERSSLQKLGEYMELSIDLESRIKRAKRWLNNKWVEHKLYFLPYIKPILNLMLAKGELILAIDGSTVGKDCMALMLSLIWKKRAIPLCWVVRKAPKGHFPENMHLDLLAQFADILEPMATTCRITLLGDGEFCGVELQKFCRAHQWEYVCRIAKDTLLTESPHSDDMLKIGAIEPENGTYMMINNGYITQQKYGPVHILYWKEPKYKDPLLLVTNIEFPHLAASLYKKRFGIETFFSDIKSRGFHITRTKVENPETLKNLLIVASLAYVFAILTYKQALESQNIGAFCRKDRIESLSVFQIGFRAIKYFIEIQCAIIPDYSKWFL